MRVLKEHRERQKKLLPLFSPELRATRMAFAKGIWDVFLVFTVVFWVSISFLYGAGYDTMRHIKEATLIFRNFDDSQTAQQLSSAIVAAFKDPGVPLLKDYTGSGSYQSIDAIKDAVWSGDAWGAIYVNDGFGERLEKALTEGADYDPKSAVTLVTEESRHYFKVMMVNKGAQSALSELEGVFAQQVFTQLTSAEGANITSIIDSANSAALITPFSYTIDNIAPYHFDMSMYILSVTLSLCMVVGSFIPSNMWKSIEEPFFKQVRVPQIIALRAFINIVWAIFICVQATGIVFAFHGPSWSPTVGDFFAIFAIFLLNTLAFTFFIDCMQNWVHPRFLLGGYFTTLFVNIAGAMFGAELNNHFFRICYALPFHSSGLMLRTLLTDGSYNKLDFAIPINILWSLFWWTISSFLIARKARLVYDGKILMSNVPPPNPQPAAVVHEKDSAAAPHAESPSASHESEYVSSTTGSPDSSHTDISSHMSRQRARKRTESEVSDIEIEDA
ncbi:hypothetical protein IWW36_001543 [Coemansia brasiliensis]|uniref:DUF3533 domain-containing protein n=1 Tax=Coemansia brasiliensis TaxID=2650707 RepID=A0A9W8IBF0_9FUNG|nr:hypothetical protein IWW36_001543 [Coemansia brasiliensis]